MPDLLVALMLLIAVAVGWIGVLRLTRSVRHTSLTAAAAWAIWFQVALTITAIATLAKNQVQPGILDQLWYLTAVSALCPFVAVLGARRGRLLEWSLFIVLPLIVVLEWPALAQFRSCWNGQRLELETPALIGYAVVLVMSVGNFLGTRFSIAAVSWLWTWVLIGWSHRESAGLNRYSDHRVAIFCLWQTSLILAFVARRRVSTTSGWNRVWQDYRDHFGNLWSLRLKARLNEVAQREKWPWTVAEDGLKPVDPQNGPAGDPTDDPRVDHAFRWLLKSFVDPEWIDERLNAAIPQGNGRLIGTPIGDCASGPKGRDTPAQGKATNGSDALGGSP